MIRANVRDGADGCPVLDTVVGGRAPRLCESDPAQHHDRDVVA